MTRLSSASLESTATVMTEPSYEMAESEMETAVEASSLPLPFRTAAPVAVAAAAAAADTDDADRAAWMLAKAPWFMLPPEALVVVASGAAVVWANVVPARAASAKRRGKENMPASPLVVVGVCKVGGETGVEGRVGIGGEVQN